MSAYGYRQHILETASSRTVISTGDTISISQQQDTITTNGLVLQPTSITFTATTTGIFSNIPAANITWKNGSTVLGTGAQYLLNNDNYGFNALASSGSYTITAIAVINPSALTPVSKTATKTITLSSNNISANISPATAQYTTDSSGNGTANIQLTMNIQAGIDSVASGWQYTWSGATFSGGINTQQTVTVIGIGSDTATVSCTATKDGYSISKTAVISKSKTGTQGPGGASVKLIYLRSATAPTISPNTTTDPTIPASWSTTVPAAGAGYIYVQTGNKPSGDTTWTWGTPVLMEGQPGANGAPGTNGKKVLSGYVYWSSTSTGQSGPALSSAVYNFTNNTFDSLNGWSQEVVFNASGTNLTKYFTVTETTAGGGTGTATFGNAYTHTSFAGLVTFTSLGGNGSTTFIDGGKITSGTISGRKISTYDSMNPQSTYVEMENTGSSNPHTFTGYVPAGIGYASSDRAFRLTANSGLIGFTQTLEIKGLGFNNKAIDAQGIILGANGSSYGQLGFATGGIGVYGFGTSTGVQADGSSSGISGSSYSGQGGYFSGGEGIRAVHPRTDIGGQAIHAESSFGTGVYGIGTTHDFYAGGPGVNYGPFTGQHDGILDTLSSAVIGDILVDISVLAKRNVSNTITTVSLSTIPNQKGTIGVLQDRYLFDLDNINIPSAFTNDSIKLDKYGDALYYAYALNWYKTNGPTASLDKNVDRVAFNALGEGQINVCGENGDLSIGDLIVTSSIPGKGMKQADDIVRSYTVAKCREAVTFSSPTEVKMVACIYLCG